MPFGDLLPVPPGTHLVAGETDALLVANAPDIWRVLSDMGGMAQYEARIEWDPLASLATARAHAGVPEIRARVGEGRLALGRRVAEAVADLAERLGADIAREIGRVAVDTIHLPRRDDRSLAALAVLVRREDEVLLERALEAVETWGLAEPRIRLIGPSPPVSFAVVALERPDARDVRAARRLLGMNDAETNADRAFRMSLDRVAEDADLARLRAARDLVRQLGAARERLEAAGLAGPAPLVVFRRDDQAVGPPRGRSAA